jgi:hypothetical protein
MSVLSATGARERLCRLSLVGLAPHHPSVHPQTVGESAGGLYCCRLPSPERLLLRQRLPFDTACVTCDAAGQALFTQSTPEYGRRVVRVGRLPALAAPGVSALAAGIAGLEVSGARMLRGSASMHGRREGAATTPGLKQQSVDSMDSPVRDVGFGRWVGFGCRAVRRQVMVAKRHPRDSV